MTQNEAYLEAEQKIEEARRTGATELDLSTKYDAPDEEKLTELPESMWELTQLQSLNLRSNKLAAVPDTIGQLSQLQKLDLSENLLTAVPETICLLIKLQALDISYNKLTLVPESIGQLTKLDTLNISGNQLTAIPNIIGQLDQLQSLYLSFNQLTYVPNTISQLTNLKYLDLAENQLTAIPETLGQLTKLQRLSLQINQLTSLPNSLDKLKKLKSLNLFNNNIQYLPDWLGELQSLESIGLGANPLTTLPDSLGNCASLRVLDLGDIAGGCPLEEFPKFIRRLHKLESLIAMECNLEQLPDWVGELTQIREIDISRNKISDLPTSLAQLEYLETLGLFGNPLNPELAAAYEDGLDVVNAYLRAKAGAQIKLNEAKLILVGEGEVGKTCLMDALEGKPWEEHPTTHGIEIRTISAVDPASGTEITLNGWDFGGQRVYRPTHQLFFSSPAVYLVVWKPREGPQQGFVKEWIKLIKHREPEAKILVVATHGGPQQRQPDIDRQELKDLFGEETILGFFFVDSKPDENGQRRGITELKQVIARVAANLPEMGREVPESFQKTRETLAKTDAAYLPLTEVHAICYEHGMEKQLAKLFVAISHRLGHLIHYEHDPALRDIVILKPDWLTTAISFVLDDKKTRQNYGLVSFERLSQLWHDPKKRKEERYEPGLHRIFLRLMERFDLSYRVAGISPNEEHNPISLIAQLVPDNRPEEALQAQWEKHLLPGDSERVQICQIVDEQRGQSANAEGLFYQLVVRLHRYSLGSTNYHDSIHWQRGLVLDHEYNGRALLEHKGNDIRITVRAPYPERFLTMLTEEVKYLVESFWEGLRCNVMVPCMTPCGKNAPGTGLFEVEKLIDSKRKNRPEYPCTVCNEWQDIDQLLRNAPAASPAAVNELLGNHELLQVLRGMRILMIDQHEKSKERFDQLDAGQRELLSKADEAYEGLMKALTDEAKEGPRLFSFYPVDRSRFNPKSWTKTKFRLMLWCEHSRRPVFILDRVDSKTGIIEVELTRDWFKKAAPWLKFLTGTLSLVLPVSISGIKLEMDEAAYKAIEEQLDFSQKIIDASLTGAEKSLTWLGGSDKALPEHDDAVRATGGLLRELHAIIKEKDPSFGNLVRVRNKRQEFLWVHPQFGGEY